MKSGLLLFICICVMGCASVSPSRQQDEALKQAILILDNSADVFEVCKKNNIIVDSLKIKDYLDTTNSFMNHFRKTKLKYKILLSSQKQYNDLTTYILLARAEDGVNSVELHLTYNTIKASWELDFLDFYQWFEN